MTKKLMCHNYMTIKEGGHLWCKGSGKISQCPKNTNSKCEITPAKPKVRRVKAWACLSYGDVCALSVKSGPYTMPCTILIDEKYLKEGK